MPVSRTIGAVENKGTILVVDDDRLVLATLTHGLAQAGYRIVDADNGDDAILLARQHKPDLALLAWIQGQETPPDELKCIVEKLTQ